MLKPLTLSLSLAVALVASSVSMAGGLFHGGNSGCSTCGLASEQGPAPHQGVVASAQSDCGFAAPKKCSLFSGFHFKKPHLFNVQYEWVLKKKLVWAHKSGCGGGCGDVGCAPSILPSSQSVASPQAYSTGQSVIPTGQAYYGGTPAPSYASTPVYSAPAAPSVAAAGDEAPPAPEATEPPPAPAAPAPATPAPATPAPNAPQTSLLFSTPSSN